MPCDDKDECPYPGEPGYAGALEPEHVELAEAYKRYSKLGSWAIEPVRRGMTPAQDAELVHIIYELSLEHTRLKATYPDVRLLWDAEDVKQG